MDDSPFLKLSPELRNQVYDLASLTPGGVFIELAQNRTEQHAWQLKHRTCHPHPLALTEVSQEVRKETMGAFLAVNSVSLIVPLVADASPGSYVPPWYFVAKIKEWLNSLDPRERAALRTIELDIGTWRVNQLGSGVSVEDLASALVDLAVIFETARISVTVWITVVDTNPCLESLPISFKLSSCNGGGLCTVTHNTFERGMDLNAADFKARRIDHELFNARQARLDRFHKRLRKLADALEDAIGRLSEQG